MQKWLSGAALGAALLFGATANAATMVFQFDPSQSSITVTNQGGGPCLWCSVTPSLDLPAGQFTLTEGVPQSFDFADFDTTGLGKDTGVQLSATLAFLEPSAGPVSATGNAWYATLFGVVTGGQLTWEPVAPITTSDGSQFTVAFQDLSGVDIGTVTDHVTITVDSVAAPAAPAPEPETWAMLLLGLFGTGALLRARRKAAAVAAA